MFKNYTYLKNGFVKYEEEEILYTSSKLEPGLYELTYIEYPDYKTSVKKLDIKSKSKIVHNCDELIYGIVDSFIDDNKNKKLKENNIDNRFGILLYGDAGTGKSSIINDIISKYDNTLSFIISSKNTEHIKNCWDTIATIREGQDNKIFIIFDEFDEFMGSEALLKQIMDGQYSIDDCLFLMTTNYISSIPDTILNRPSRCKYKIKVEGIYNKDVIRNLITNIGLNEDEIIKYSKELDGKTLDEIKNFCIDKILNLKEFKSSNNKIGFKI